MDERDRRTIERVIPLPHEVTVAGSRKVPRGNVAVVCGPEVPAAEARVATALAVLAEAGLGPGTSGASLLIECRFASGGGLRPGAAMGAARRLPSLPHAEQAYAIVPDGASAGTMGTLTLLANAPLGILYAARTLVAMASSAADGSVDVPCVSVTDWPDIGERGQWGGNTHDEMETNARWKLNVIEESVGISVDGSGHTSLALAQEYISRSHAAGVSIVPYILHLEQVALYAGLMSRADITSTPDPSKPLPGEYVPGLCMSSAATIRLVGDWMELIAGYDHIPAIEVWLSEDRSPCYCDRCRDREPFELEVRCIQEAFRRARARRPGLALRILLTQGSYAVNDRVIAASDPDVQLTYYDGGRTYDSSHAPMIYPLLEKYARSGRWLGVYPQITHCWRTVFPFTAPQLLAARAGEFAEKGLANVIGYAVPSNRHHEANVAALAEWSWNHRGRSPEEFARAYARAKGMPDPELYGRWALLAGDAGWWLAESRMLLRFIYNYDVEIAVGGELTGDHRFRHAGVSYERSTIERAVATAAEARAIAASSGVEALVDESDAVHAGLVALLAVDELARGRRGADASSVAGTLERLDRASAVVCRSVSRWGERINASIPDTSPAVGATWVRLRDTANALFRVCDTLRTKAAFRDIPDPHAAYRERRIGRFSARDFGPDRTARFSFDVTESVHGASGHCFACFTYEGGEYAAEVAAVSLSRRSTGGVAETLSRSGDGRMRVGRWETWHELKVELPRAALRGGERLFLDVELVVVVLDGAKRETWECSGLMGFRLGWPADTRV